MASVNKVIILGNVGREPEIKTLNDGTKLANLSIATSERWRDKNSGETKEKTEWHRVTIGGENMVRIVQSYVKKGDPIYLEGKLETRKWTDQQGADRFSTDEIPF